MKADVETWIPLSISMQRVVAKVDPRAERERQAFQDACDRVNREWGGSAPTMGGVPLSRELAGMLGVKA